METFNINTFVDSLTSNKIKIVTFDCDGFIYTYFHDKRFGVEFYLANFIMSDYIRLIIEKIKIIHIDIRPKIVFTSEMRPLTGGTYPDLGKLFDLDKSDYNFIHSSYSSDTLSAAYHYLNLGTHEHATIHKYIEVMGNKCSMLDITRYGFSTRLILFIVTKIYNVSLSEIMHVTRLAFPRHIQYLVNCSTVNETLPRSRVIADSYEINCYFNKRRIYNFTNYSQYSSTLYVESHNNCIIIDSSDQLKFAECLKQYSQPCDIILLKNETDHTRDMILNCYKMNISDGIKKT